MAKVQQSTKALKSRNNHAVEQHNSYDDNPFPDAEELSKLKALDPNIIEYLKERGKREQDGRLDFNDRRMKVVEKSEGRTFTLNITALYMAYSLIIITMGAAIYFLINNLPWPGSITGGVSIYLIIQAFLASNKSQKAAKEK